MQGYVLANRYDEDHPQSITHAEGFCGAEVYRTATGTRRLKHRPLGSDPVFRQTKAGTAEFARFSRA